MYENGFYLSEEKGRKKLESFLKQMGFNAMSPSQGAFNKVDYFGVKNGKKYVFEIKVRNTIYDDWIIQDDKMEALKIQKYDNDLDGAFYANFYDNYLYLYDVENTPYSSSTMVMPTTTMGNGWDVEKYVHHYGFDNAWIYQYQNNSWELISTPQYKKEEKDETTDRKEKTTKEG